jgi:hypothetical protein
VRLSDLARLVRTQLKQVCKMHRKYNIFSPSRTSFRRVYLGDGVEQLSEQFVERVLQRSYTSIGNNSVLDVSPDEHVAQALLPAASSVAAVAPLAIRGVTEERVRARQRSFEVSKLDLADDDRVTAARHLKFSHMFGLIKRLFQNRRVHPLQCGLQFGPFCVQLPELVVSASQGSSGHPW